LHVSTEVELKMAEKVVIGNATLYLGDCLEILPALGRFDAVVTDAPYGISDAPLKLGKRALNAKRQSGTDSDYHAKSHWDAEIKPEWCAAVGKAAQVVGWFGQWRKRAHVEAHMGLPLRCEIIWAKDCHAGPPCPVAMRDERIWVFSEKGLSNRPFETSVWDWPVIPTWEHKFHKNQKPVGLMSKLVRFCTDGSVLDPFMGSGTTGVACADLGRSFTGIEIDPAHFDNACKRIEAAQSQKRLFA